jgi:hypothetical protein
MVRGYLVKVAVSVQRNRRNGQITISIPRRVRAELQDTLGEASWLDMKVVPKGETGKRCIVLDNFRLGYKQRREKLNAKRPWGPDPAEKQAQMEMLKEKGYGTIVHHATPTFGRNNNPSSPQPELRRFGPRLLTREEAEAAGYKWD